jgi:hypothetical protein
MNLLLDTLSNALGGVIFIALLVVLIAYQVPVLEDSSAQTTSPIHDSENIIKALKELPSIQSLTTSLDQYTLALSDYQSSDLVPLHVTDSMEKLLNERELLKKKQQTSAPPQVANYHVPALRKIPRADDAYIAVFKGQQVFSAPLNGSRSNSSQSLLPRNLTFSFLQNSLIINVKENEGKTVSQALNQLFTDIKSIDSHLKTQKTQLFLFVYPDSIQEFHTYRKQAMRSLPYTNWIGLTEQSLPRLSFQSTSESNSDTHLGF